MGTDFNVPMTSCHHYQENEEKMYISKYTKLNRKQYSEIL